MKNNNDMNLSTLYDFLRCVADNEIVYMMEITMKTELSLSTAMKLKRILLPAGFLKICGGNCRRVDFRLTDEGIILLKQIEKIVKGEKPIL